ncbi:clp protease family protein [Orientia tsutsugamushi str. UT144]|nr:clp protease family protein [Orientia tsutsugamushi str. UT144]
MIHQPSGGFQGQATDIQIHAQEILKMKKIINNLYVHHTNQPLQVIEESMERDNFMDPVAAKEFGLVDHITTERAQVAERK